MEPRSGSAETLLPLIVEDEDEAARLATERLERFPAVFEAAHARVLRAKLGLAREEAGDLELVMELLLQLATNEVDYTVFFRALSTDPGSFVEREWIERWRARLAAEGESPETRAEAMRRVNPTFIPRNHRVEEVIAAAYTRTTSSRSRRSCASCKIRTTSSRRCAHLAEPPKPDERVTQTFCGT